MWRMPLPAFHLRAPAGDHGVCFTGKLAQDYQARTLVRTEDSSLAALELPQSYSDASSFPSRIRARLLQVWLARTTSGPRVSDQLAIDQSRYRQGLGTGPRKTTGRGNQGDRILRRRQR